MVKLIPTSKSLLAVGTVIVALIMAFSLLSIVEFDVASIVAAVTLWILAGVILLETVTEEKIRRLSQIRLVHAIALTIALVSIVAGLVLSAFGVQSIPLQWRGVLGFFFIIDAVIVIAEMRR